jgi:putrescine transport system ATP-binding protein
VALARALAKQPKLLLLDEPLGALDRKLREHTQFELVNIQEQVGVTCVMVTHDQEEAMTMSSRVAVMHEGRILQLGPPASVYEYPNCRFVAEFVGAANLLEGRVLGREPGGLRVQSSDACCELLVEHAEALVPGTPVWVAVRPEKLRVAPASEPGAANRVTGVVAEIGYLGDVSIYHVRLPGGKLMQAQVTNERRYAGRPLTWDQEVHLAWDPANSILLQQ